MTKFVEKEKLSKKARKALNAQQRGDWNGTNPVTRVIPSRGRNAYDRRKEKQDVLRAASCAW